VIQGSLDALAEAVESGAGLPAIARAAAKVLDASVALIDRSSAVLAVAGASSDQEKKLIAGGDDVARIELRVADSVVGELRYRSKAEPNPAIARMVTTLLALELERRARRSGRARRSPGLRRRRARPRGDRPRRHVAARRDGADLEPGPGCYRPRPAARRPDRRVAGPGPHPSPCGPLRSLAAGALATAGRG
jgi:hypothetical protein